METLAPPSTKVETTGLIIVEASQPGLTFSTFKRELVAFLEWYRGEVGLIVTNTTPDNETNFKAEVRWNMADIDESEINLVCNAKGTIQQALAASHGHYNR